ncbi:hypothetical protein EVAR_73270_1 [Eumeta japonica]|uniref:Uncharacterized protein n=1 Tax=Eumeta variegata TaxID=151549 RepID=A0A4C1SEG4_EUMVA|nr:hypothetical protein EVAR_73270_1 [Eumeta japonica]
MRDEAILVIAASGLGALLLRAAALSSFGKRVCTIFICGPSAAADKGKKESQLTWVLSNSVPLGQPEKRGREWEKDQKRKKDRDKMGGIKRQSLVHKVRLVSAQLYATTFPLTNETSAPKLTVGSSV